MVVLASGRLLCKDHVEYNMLVQAVVSNLTTRPIWVAYCSLDTVCIYRILWHRHILYWTAVRHRHIAFFGSRGRAGVTPHRHYQVHANFATCFRSFPGKLDVSPLRQFAPWTFRPQDVSPSGGIQRFLVTLYILSFIVVKLRLTTFIKANDDDDPAYSVKTKHRGRNVLGRNVQGRTDEGAKRPRSKRETKREKSANWKTWRQTCKGTGI